MRGRALGGAGVVTVLRFEGIVECEEFDNPGWIKIGGVSVLGALDTAFEERPGQEWPHAERGKVIVQINRETFTGEMSVALGSSGYSECTPGENEFFYVGDSDLAEMLYRRKGEHIVLEVATA